MENQSRLRPNARQHDVALPNEIGIIGVLMARRVFFSFHYKPDHWRASQVRNMGVIEGDAGVSDNDWENITNGGDDAIKRWIDGQMSGKSCAVVLIGKETAGRKWIEHEICKAWNDKKGVLGIYIHNLKGNDQKQSTKGANPFDSITFGVNKAKLSTIVKAYDPALSDSTEVYAYIKKNLSDWVEAAVKIRDAN
jgi:hypothetical protein